MQIFDEKSTAALADEVVDAALLVTRLVRREVGRRRPGGLTVSQVRALSFLHWNPGASLADVAEYIGLGAPATSRMVDDLVRRELVARAAAADDRRRIALALLPAGSGALEAAVAAARTPLAERLEALGAQEKARLSAAMTSLREALVTEPAAAGGTRG